MNTRRDFFRKLVLGAAALPVVVKVAMDEPLRGLRKNTVVLDEAQQMPYVWFTGEKMFVYDGQQYVEWSLDQHPMRFDSFARDYSPSA